MVSRPQALGSLGGECSKAFFEDPPPQDLLSQNPRRDLHARAADRPPHVILELTKGALEG